MPVQRRSTRCARAAKTQKIDTAWQDAYQASDDLDGRLIASVASSSNKHCEKYSDNKMLPQKLLVLLKHKGRCALQHQQS